MLLIFFCSSDKWIGEAVGGAPEVTSKQSTTW